MAQLGPIYFLKSKKCFLCREILKENGCDVRSLGHLLRTFSHLLTDKTNDGTEPGVQICSSCYEQLKASISFIQSVTEKQDRLMKLLDDQEYDIEAQIELHGLITACRLCLNKNGNVSTAPTKLEEIEKQLDCVFRIKIIDHRKLSKSVCSVCFETIESFDNFMFMVCEKHKNRNSPASEHDSNDGQLECVDLLDSDSDDLVENNKIENRSTLNISKKSKNQTIPKTADSQVIVIDSESDSESQIVEVFNGNADIYQCYHCKQLFEQELLFVRHECSKLNGGLPSAQNSSEKTAPKPTVPASKKPTNQTPPPPLCQSSNGQKIEITCKCSKCKRRIFEAKNKCIESEQNPSTTESPKTKNSSSSEPQSPKTKNPSISEPPQTCTFQCKECIREFPSRSFLLAHMVVSHTRRKYPCDQCGLRFLTNGSLKHHHQTIHTEKRYTCYRCRAKFPISLLLQRHMAEKHDVVSSPVPGINKNATASEQEQDSCRVTRSKGGAGEHNLEPVNPL
ncbi:zinc finger protein 567-like [Uranotaenia lowii]|uniref:zinc finger protein 567-like n=1 Tax=Uranotaenia lowii TaxID=190385 RepID=UPI00247A8447|nr:zinc finger protein 567-like [Uranotaenia lowii]